MSSYKGIEFAEGIDLPFAEFEKVYGDNHVFNTMLPKVRKVELKKAYEIATRKQDGNTSRAATKGEEDPAQKPADGSI